MTAWVPASSLSHTSAHSLSAGNVFVICSGIAVMVPVRRGYHVVPMPPRVPSRGIVLFRLGPIEVAVHPSWLIMFAVIAWVMNAEVVPGVVHSDSGLGPLLAIGIALMFYSFILLHELS